MHDVRNRKSGPDEAARQKPAARRKRRTAVKQGEVPPAPAASAPPFLLATPTGPIHATGPGFPRDVTVPPHRGALIVAAPPAPEVPPLDGYVIEPARPATPRKRAKSAGKNAATPRTGQPQQGKAKPDTAARSAPSRPARTRSVPTAKATPSPIKGEPAPAPSAAAVMTQPAAPPIAPPIAPLAAVPLAERLAHVPPRRDRALVRQGGSVVARVVAWLGRLMPRQRRSALPRARTRLIRQDHAAAGPMSPPAADAGPELNRRMLLELSQENERLRREVAALRATLGETARP